MAQTIDFEGGFALLDGGESVRRRVLQALRMSVGEWFLDRAAGTPYLGGVLGHVDVALAEQVVRARAAAVDGVASVFRTQVLHDAEARHLTLRLLVDTEDDERVAVEAQV